MIILMKLFLLLLWICYVTSHAISFDLANLNEETVENLTANNESEKATFEQILEANEHAHMLEYLNEGDIRRYPFRNANGRKWPKSRDGYVRIPYVIEDKYTPRHKQIIESAITSFKKHTCIRFERRKSERNYLSIESRGGCWSYIGRTGLSKQTISLDRGGCVHRGTTMHELMHAIGFEHEQSRSDRDKYIRVVYENVLGGTANNNFRKYSRTTNLVIYDYSSIMHYSSGSFSKHPLLKSIEIYPKRNPEPSIGFRHQMSAYDIEEIKYYYECKPGTYSRCGKDFLNQRSGTFQSENYPRNYGTESHCTWRISVRPGRYVRVTIATIDIEDSTLCQSDALIFHNGRNGGAPVIERMCGKRSSVVITSTGNHMFIIFTSDARNERKGFRASFQEVTTKGSPPPAIPTEAPAPRNPKFSNGVRCNFDSSSLCGFTQDKTDRADFRFHQGATLSRRTGPSSDHTTGRGRYIYVEANGARYRDSAIIRSPWFKRSFSFCIKFNYHMYGRYMGGLRLFAYEKRRGSNKAQEKLVWEKFGDQKNLWHERTEFYRPSSTVEYLQFYWKAIIRFDSSDIALDDILINPGSCNAPPPPNPPRPSVSVYTSANCNFERSICNFRQKTTDTFDWTRRTGATPSQETGPSRDHTTGRGYYMHIEASPPRKQGDVAQFESPRLTNGPHCVSLWYNMNGRNIGRLTLYTEPNGIRQQRRQIQEIRGNQGSSWKHLEVDVALQSRRDPLNSDNNEIKHMPASQSGSYLKVIIEAAVGDGTKGDIAVDDVVITDKACSTPVIPATTPPPAPRNGFSCSFESGRSLCGLQQLRNDQFDWIIRKGTTPSRGTGPSVDNTRKTAQGYYIYIEASRPRSPNHEAKLQTPSLRPGQYCVQFAYHMFGTAVGSLAVLSREGSNGERIRWMKNGNQQNRWHRASFQFNSVDRSKPVYFLFYGKVGRTSSSDIALDDIVIASGVCRPTQTTTSPRTTRRSTPKPVTSTAPTSTIRPYPTQTFGQQLWSGMPTCTFENKPSRINPTPPIRSLSANDLGPYELPSSVRNDPACGWKQLGGSNAFTWTRHKGATPSAKTGPTGDSSRTGRGYYMYMEASSPRKAGDVATMQTYYMPAADYCVVMYYHMSGVTMGKLVLRTIETLRNGSQTRNVFFELNGDQGDKWTFERIDYTPEKSVMSVFFRWQGIVGQGSKSDMGLDQLGVIPGKCRACRTPTHTYRTSSNENRQFVAGCIHTRLFYARCCGGNQQKFIYRRVRNCNVNIFTAAQLNRLCEK